MARKATRHECNVGHHVKGIGDNDQDCVWAVCDEVFGDCTHDVGVYGEQVVPAHARLAGNPGGDHADIRIRGRRVIIRRPGYPSIKQMDRRGFPHIERLSFGQPRFDID